jgi:hypothetical protein
VVTYAQTEHDIAATLGLGIINGLNIADGGDGSSGQPGASPGKYAMSAAEISNYGTALLSVSGVQMFLMWEYDGSQIWSDGVTVGGDYFDRPEIQAALADLGSLAALYSL